MSWETTNNSSSRANFWNIGLGHEKEYFIDNLIILLDSGMGILEALEAIREGSHSRRMQKIITEIKEQIRSGATLSETLRRTNLFSQKFISLVSIGESAGRLSENLKVISFQQQKEKIFASRIRSAMMYPALVFSLVIIIGTGLVWFLLPRLAVVFSQLDVTLPPLTRILMAAGEFFGQYGLIFFPTLFFTLFVVLFFFFWFPKTKFIGQYILFHLPLVKRLIQYRELSRFGYVLGTLLEAGIPIMNALQSLERVTTFYNYKAFYEYLHRSIVEGNSFHTSFKSYALVNKLMPVPIQQMILSGEQSGKLAFIMSKVGDIFEVKLDTAAKNLTVLLEPILLIIVWLGVMTLALAIVVPVYSLIGNLN